MYSSNPKLYSSKESSTSSCEQIVYICLSILLITGGVVYATGCHKIGKCYAPDKITAVVTENTIDYHNCTQETINGNAPFELECAEHDTNPSCARFYDGTNDCVPGNIYYKCLQFRTFYCFNNTMHVTYGNSQTCVVTQQWVETNVTMVPHAVNSTVDIYVDKKSACSLKNNYPSNHRSLIGFCILIITIPIALICFGMIHDSKRYSETTINSPVTLSS